MKKMLTIKEYENMSNEYEKVKYRCNHCGHKVAIPAWVDKQMCSWCHHYVFKDKKTEFDYRMSEKLRRTEME